MNIGLYFGSFNPIHIGHLIIGSTFAENAEVDQVWFVVSPQNPFKKKANLLNEHDRLHLIELAIEGCDNLRTSNIEFSLPKPSYTIDTLTHLDEKYPDHNFSILMGGDSIVSLPKWKNADIIIRKYPIYVYPRPGQVLKDNYEGSIKVMDVPLLDISATTIRNRVKAKQKVTFLVPKAVEQYMADYNLYE